MIESLLDTDWYGFPLRQIIEARHPHAVARYRFRCRNRDVDLRPFREEVEAAIRDLGDLSFTGEDLAYLRGLRPPYEIADTFLRPTFVDQLTYFRFDPAMQVRVFEENDQLAIEALGRWGDVKLYEVPILALVNEIYFRRRAGESGLDWRAEGMRRLRDGIAWVKSQPEEIWRSFRFSEFGTRRRFSRAWQEEVVLTLKAELPEQLIGTSNVRLAREYGLPPVGTMDHGYLQAYQALGPIVGFQRRALEEWLLEFRGNFGVALSDVVGFDAFLRDFDFLLAKAFDGARHDSGDPDEWGWKLVRHYRGLGINPNEKIGLWSNSLDWEQALALHREFRATLKTRFGIGTFLTNNVGFEPLNIVMKLVELNGLPVAKISDDPGKAVGGDEVYLAYLRQAIGLP